MSKQQKQQPASLQIEIEINGEKYPYIETMGAMMGFKQETGLDAPVDMEDTVKYMYHVVKAVCRREKRPFDLSFEEFADGLDGDEFLRVTAALAAKTSGNVKEGDGKNV